MSFIDNLSKKIVFYMKRDLKCNCDDYFYDSKCEGCNTRICKECVKK